LLHSGFQINKPRSGLKKIINSGPGIYCLGTGHELQEFEAEKKIKNNPQATSSKLHEPGKPGVVGAGGPRRRKH